MTLRKLKRKKKRSQPRHDPDKAQIYFTTATDHKQNGRLEKAVSFFHKALQYDPHHGDSHNNLGNTLHSLNRLQEAVECYRTACELLPSSHQAHFNLGTALYESDEKDEAIEELQRAIEIFPDYAEAHASLGVAYQSLGQLDLANQALNRSISINPNYTKAHRFLGLILKDQGNTTAASAKFSEILQTHPEDAFSRYLLSRYSKSTSTDEAEVALILSQLSSKKITKEDAVFLHFTLGKIYDDLHLYNDAFHHYCLGNQKKRTSFGQAIITPGIDIKEIQATFTSTLFDRLSPFGSQSELPVFIVGMPRSGTTLVEQICASHSAAYGAGELMAVNKIVQSLKVKERKLKRELNNSRHSLKKPKSGSGKKIAAYPARLTTLPPKQITTLAEEYLSGIQNCLSVATLRVTDKMPTNFIELGLIRILFPKARIIHCQRDPLDTCLSNFFQNFEEGNECSFNMDELAYYYQKYRQLMDLWKKIIPGLYEINYEELVADSEGQSKKLIEYLGLPWEENCLAFFKTKRMVHTSSDWQVRQPIYSGSVRRWQNYEEQIKKVESWRKLIDSKH